MESALNPYRPGAGLQPPEFAGRDAQINYFDMLIIKSKRRIVDRGMVMSGLRGVGKTVLMNKFLTMAEQHQWICVSFEGQASTSGVQGIRRRLSAEVRSALMRFSMKQRARQGFDFLLQLAGNFSLDLGPVSVERRMEPAATGILDIDLEELVVQISTMAQERQCAFALFVDEMQDVDSELLSALLVVQHKTQQRGLPFYLIGTGLPNLPGALTETRSYAERLFQYSTIGPLSPNESKQALVLPASRLGCIFEPDALDWLVEATEGYAYFIQEYGRAIWDVAQTRPFTLAHAQGAVIVGDAQLDAGFFPARWERATIKEREYMCAMSDVGVGEVRTADIAELLEKAPTALSPTRGSLIRKGLIFAPERGRIAFTVPGMGEYIRRTVRFDD